MSKFVSLPQDLNPRWYNVFRRLQSVGRRTNGCPAVIKITVLVDSNGHPQLWTEPGITKIEPKQAAHIESLREIVGDDQTGEILDLLE